MVKSYKASKNSLFMKVKISMELSLHLAARERKTE
jgi:hypothetical protein